MSQRHLSISLLLANAAAVVALGLPGMASAAYEHATTTEKGVVVHPQHFISQKTRAQVRAETEAAMRQGLLIYGDGNYQVQLPAAKGPGKTRQEVIRELLNETPAQREARIRAMAG
ncbi:DUF4148 domain-containing protein [Comamonas sp. lk]|uniref:DUF4148 domain-containing protein n=1 Tax=Comamonas sp. lk TaxID=2201272 RepID=UPI000EB53592|nr:DUF4148 domain-containing protein [Comamonas sp. lk]